MAKYLYSNSKAFRKEAVWSFGNLLAGSEPLIQAVCVYNQGEIIDRLIEIFNDESQPHDVDF